MTKKLFILLTMCLTFIGILFWLTNEKKKENSYIEISFDPDSRMYIATIHDLQSIKTVRSWFDPVEEKYYFFLPSYAKEKRVVDCCSSEVPVPYEELIFMYSSNIPALYVETDDLQEDAYYVPREFLYLDKENSISGDLTILLEDGNVDYCGRLEGIRGRGNFTWSNYAKRPFNLYLEKSSPLLHMRQGRKWTLLALAGEGTHLNTRLAMDIADELGLPYTPKSEWVDFYFNGEYFGNYLLIESIDIGSGRIPIFDLEKWNKENNEQIETAPRFWREREKGFLLENGEKTDGGYLIEKEYPTNYDADDCGFNLGNRECFAIREPNHASEEQVKYIRSYFEKISNSIAEGKPDYRILDLDTLAKRTVIDEISLNYDAFNASVFFFKKQGDDKIYSGPIWDYDNSFGEMSNPNPKKNFVDPEETILETGIWYDELVKDELFMEEKDQDYRMIETTLCEIADKRIDAYTSYIKDSVTMDEIRWEVSRRKAKRGGQYQSYENNVRFLKWFFMNRVNHLYSIRNLPHDELLFSGNDVTHMVTIMKDDTVFATYEVRDGEFLGALPDLSDEYLGWYMEFNNVAYQECLPILEDTVIYAKKVAN